MQEAAVGSHYDLQRSIYLGELVLSQISRIGNDIVELQVIAWCRMSCEGYCKLQNVGCAVDLYSRYYSFI